MPGTADDDGRQPHAAGKHVQARVSQPGGRYTPRAATLAHPEVAIVRAAVVIRLPEIARQLDVEIAMQLQPYVRAYVWR
jgi:hypothetical protein